MDEINGLKFGVGAKTFGVHHGVFEFGEGALLGINDRVYSHMPPDRKITDGFGYNIEGPNVTIGE